jgi:3-deoxy-D-manno-octulosonate 8-phosphate phosphatase (KDO 8-P phosphatase)
MRPSAPAAGARRPARESAPGLRLLALDVDGTLTDGAILIGPQGEAMKAFSVRDGFGLALLREAGLHIAIITGRRSAIVERRAAELGIAHVRQSVSDKAQALRALCAELGINPAQAAFMGDDWPDLPAMRLAGLALAPADADPEVRARADWVASRPGGHGAVREFADWWLARRGLRQAQLQRWLDQADAPGARDPARDAGHANPAGAPGQSAGTPG